jgi:hypothetical protein
MHEHVGNRRSNLPIQRKVFDRNQMEDYSISIVTAEAIQRGTT